MKQVKNICDCTRSQKYLEMVVDALSDNEVIIRRKALWYIKDLVYDIMKLETARTTSTLEKLL